MIVSYVRIPFFLISRRQVFLSMVRQSNKIWENLRTELYNYTSDHNRLRQTSKKKKVVLCYHAVPSPTQRI